MSARLQHGDAPAVGTLAEEAPQSQPASPPAPVAPAAEEPPRRRLGPFLRAHRAVKEIEPWGILLAVVALVLSLVAFWIDYSDRVEERTVRAWQLLTTRAPGNSGKITALEYLNREDGLFCGDDGCLLTLKEREPLVGIDLSVDPESLQRRGSGVHLVGVDLQNADLRHANLSYADLDVADLRGANLLGADLSWTTMVDVRATDAELSGADLTYTILNFASLDRAIFFGASLREVGLIDAILSGANLNSADLSYADLRGARLDGASVIGAVFREANLDAADLSGATGLTQAQLDDARCGNAKLPEGLTLRPCN